MESGGIYNPGGVGEPTDKVSIHISCQNLADLDIITKSDPICHVFMKENKKDVNWFKLGETEPIENNLNPVFVTSFEINFYFEREQMLKFDVYDIDLTTKEHIGSTECTLGKIMGSHNQTYVADLFMPNKHKSRGKIIVRLEKVSTSNDMIYFNAKATNLPSSGFL